MATTCGALWCAERGKRLCGEEEWERACQGPQGFAFPYGNAHEEARCADEPVRTLSRETGEDLSFGLRSDPLHLAQPSFLRGGA